MLNWLGKVLGKTERREGPEVPQAWISEVESLLKGLDDASKARPGLARDLLAYVLTGEPHSALHDALQVPTLPVRLKLVGHNDRKAEASAAVLYAQAADVPPAVMLRWARLLDAAAASVNNSHRLPLPPGNQWPEILLLHVTGWSLNTYHGVRPRAKHLTWPYFARLLEEAGLPPSAPILAAFAMPVEQLYGAASRVLLLTDLPGYSQVVAACSDAVRPWLLPPAAPQRQYVMSLLEPLDDEVLALFVEALVELGTSSSKQVRAQAEPLVARCGAAAVAPLVHLATHGKPEQRALALRLAWAHASGSGDEALQGWARATAAADKAPSVQALPQEWERSASSAVVDEESHVYDMPVIAWQSTVTPAVSALLDALWQDVNRDIEKANRQAREHYEREAAKGPVRWKLHQNALLLPGELETLKQYIDSPVPRLPKTRQNNRPTNWQIVAPALRRLATQPAITPVALLKTLAYFELLFDHRAALLAAATNAFNAMHQACGRPALLELSLMLDEMGAPADVVFSSWCHAWGDPLGRGWRDEAVWPYFAHRLDLLVHSIRAPASRDYWFDRAGLFRAVAAFPTPPTSVVDAIFALALGSGRTDRPMAQAALANHPGKEGRIIDALADGKAETRAVAAQWLQRLRHAGAIAALETAVRKEKHDVPKGAMLDALQALGQPVEKYLDRSALATEATKSLAKGVTKDLDWFSWAALPLVRWSDSGQAVSPDVLKWLLVQAVKQKSAEPNAVLRKYCAMFEPRDREALGQFVLETWIAEDTRPIPSEQALRQAQAQAASMHAYMTRSPQYFQNDPKLGMSVEQLTAAYLPGFLRQPAGSAIASKGLLAVAAACAGQGAAAPVARYLKEYYGTRAAQGKALIAMLAWIEHPAATQLMLSVGSRFRTKSFQEEATRQAEALAERKGWTLSELADRTIPSAGFDDAGEMELSYGERRFTARLLPDFKIELFNPDGKKIAALPEPRQDDDADAAKDAKKAFSAAKKAIKSVVDMQTDRLYEALCTEREWSFDDWNRYLNQHAIVRRLVQRLVWCEVRDGVVLATFRPLEDGTLTDVEDNPLQLAPEARIRVAHDSNLAPDLVGQWQQHLVDYEVAPLFQQFGKGVYALPEDKGNEQQITDFEGWMIEAFALRGRALKLGYTRGPAEDGGWFHVYEKRFPTLGLVAVLEFTGNPLPEENRKVALLNLGFVSTQGEASQRAPLSLARVPKVLLSECWNDVRLIAADGPGFDPEWQKKSEY